MLNASIGCRRRAGRALRALGLLAVLTVQAGSSSAEDVAYPVRPLHLIVPFAAGGATDVIARMIGAEIGKTLGQPVIVENKVGAAGNIGVDYVAKSTPDGYTICFCTTGPQTLAPHLMKLPFDPLKDLVPVVHVHDVPNIILARKDLAANNLQELIVLERKQPGKLSFGTPGLGGPQHIAGEMLNSATKMRLIHVPYKGETPAFTDLAGGQIDLAIGSVSVSEPLIRAGKIKALAVTALTRSTALPDVPTAAESGISNYDSFTFVGLNLPAGSPAIATRKLNEAVNNALADPTFRTKLVAQQVAPVGGTPNAYRDFLRKEYDKAGKVISDAKITLGTP